LNGLPNNPSLLKRFGKAAQRLRAGRRYWLCGQIGFGNLSVKIAAQCCAARLDGTSEYGRRSIGSAKEIFMSDNELADLPSGLSRAGGIFSRRRLLGTTTMAVAGAALAAAQQTSAQQPQSVRVGEHNASASDPGPENEALKALNPNSFTPPPTDHGRRCFGVRSP
jgi:hypothetical protein